MKKLLITLITLIVITIITIGIYIYYKTGNKKLEVISNNIDNTSVVENNNTLEDNELQENVENENEVDDQNKQELTQEEKAIKMVRDEWEKTNGSGGVYYKIQEIKEDGSYMISVSDYDTTRVLIWYIVNLEKSTITEK